MVIRGRIACKTCGDEYILRVGVGTEKHQAHSFDCQGCGVPISIIVKTDAPQAWIVPDENAATAAEELENGTIINLHPNFAFDKEELHNPFLFASMYISKILPFMKKVPGRQQDAAQQFDVPNANFLWGLVKGIILIKHSGGDDRKLRKLINDYEKQRQKIFPQTKLNDYKAVIYNFFDSLFYPKFEKIYGPAKTLFSEAKRINPEQVASLAAWHKQNQKENTTRYISIYSDYFKVRPELSQLAFNVRIEDNDVDNIIVGSKNFDLVKLFYGQAFETLTSHFPVLAGINNILAGRKYDEFESMTWNKYINDVEKAKMANPFAHRQEFNAFAMHLDSTLRNGSHHASIWREGEFVFYRSGGTGQKREMPYSRYLCLCNELIIAISALFYLELDLNDL